MAAEILYEETLAKGLRSIDSKVQQLTNSHYQLQKSVEAMDNKLGHLQNTIERFTAEFRRAYNDKGIVSEYEKVKNSQQESGKNKLEFLEQTQSHKEENQKELTALEIQELCIEDQLFDKMFEPKILVINQRSSMIFRRWRKSCSSYESRDDEQIGINMIELDPSSVTSEVWYEKESRKHLMKRIGVSTIYSQLYPFEGLLNYTSRIIHHVKIDSLEPVTKYYYKCGYEEWRYNLSEREACTIKKSKTERSSKNFDHLRKSKIDLNAAQVTDVNNYRIFVATWNGVGKSSSSNLNIEDGLHTSPSGNIYVLGFQEIVLLNDGNVLGTEDKGPTKKWISLIRKTLNSLLGTSGGSYYTPSPVPDPIMELDADFKGSTRQKASLFIHRYSFQSLNCSMRMIDIDRSIPQPRLDRRFSVCDRVMFGQKPSDYDPNVRLGGSFDEKNGYFPFYRQGAKTVFEHDQIIWLGDLNYRIALSYYSAKALLVVYNRKVLLEIDLKVRGKSRFSDHRPVYNIFLVEVESISHSRVYNYTLDHYGLVYITVGDVGNIEEVDVEHTDDPSKCPSIRDNNPEFGGVFHWNFSYSSTKGKFCWDRQPEWSAYRESSFGHGIFEVVNSSYALWTWHMNQDVYKEFVKVVVACQKKFNSLTSGALNTTLLRTSTRQRGGSIIMKMGLNRWQEFQWLVELAAKMIVFDPGGMQFWGCNHPTFGSFQILEDKDVLNREAML